MLIHLTKQFSSFNIVEGIPHFSFLKTILEGGKKKCQRMKGLIGDAVLVQLRPLGIVGKMMLNVHTVESLATPR